MTFDQATRPLLVPINVEALLVGKESTTWGRMSLMFQNIPDNRFLGQQLQAEPFNTTKNLLKPGIHLHWALPDALCHSEAGGPGEPTRFPSIPNRWLVVRVWSSAQNSPAMSYRAWIIESDTITDEDSGKAWPALKEGRPDCVRVGRLFELSEWPGEEQLPKVSMTAVGYGDPAFAASYPACRGILGFHDDSSDLSKLEKKELAYFVAGWYADPAQDPLYRPTGEKAFDRLAEVLRQNRWVYPGFDSLVDKVERARELERKIGEAKDMLERIKESKKTLLAESSSSLADSAHSRGLSIGEKELPGHIAKLESEKTALTQEISGVFPDLPGRVLCHGAITGIKWQSKDAVYDNGVPLRKPFRLAVGNTTVEALAALFQDALGVGLAELLGAFQYDLLNELEQPGGDDALKRRLHERTFSPIVRGTRWDLRQASGQPFQGSPGTSSPPIPGDIRDLLEAPNNRQKEINQLIREKRWLQSELYAAWYKKVLNFSDNQFVKGNIIEESLAKLEREIQSLSDEIGEKLDPATKAPRGPEWAELREKIETLLPGYELLMLDESPFWRTNDPVLLLAGPAFKRSSRHGEDGRFREDGRLLCRVLGQEVAAFKITIPNATQDVKFGPADVDGWYDPFETMEAASLPTGIAELYREFLLLTADANRANGAAFAAFEKNGKGLAENNPERVKAVADQLLRYLKDLWNQARDPKTEAQATPRSYSHDTYGQTVFDLVGEFPSAVMINPWQKNPWLPMFLQWQVEWSPTYADVSSALAGWNLNEEGTGFERQPGVQERAGEPLVIAGSTLLTSGAAINLADRLREYNLSHVNPELEKLRTVIASLDLLGQNLGGFNDQLLMRKGLLELHPMDPGDRGPNLSPVYDSVRDVDWLSPLTEGGENAFFPVRAGHFSFTKLWVIDAFGRVLKLDGRELDAPCLPPPMQGPNGSVRLEPRLAQSARLFMEWLRTERSSVGGRNDALPVVDGPFEAVCGWIIPNFLDEGLMIYDADGSALGAVQSVLRKSWSEGFGGVRPEMESFHWVDIPGSDSFLFGQPPTPALDPLGEKANPHLRKFVNALLALKEGCGARLLENINFAMSTGGGNQSSNLAMLIGRPLALVRASLRLEVEGRPARAQGWEDLAKDRTGGIEKLKFPVRLGDRRRVNGAWQGSDGLAGFFLGDDYAHFYPAFGLGKPEQSDRYNVYQKEPGVAMEQALDLTLLMEPAKGVCVTAGILPRTVFHLPSGGLSDALENKEVIFYTGPLLTTPREIRMPQPSDIYGQWSWTHHPKVKVWIEKSISDSQKEQGRFFEEPFQIAEGWLKLVTAPLSIHSFGLEGKNPVGEKETPTGGELTPVPDRFDLKSGEWIVLFWEILGADSIELRQDGASVLKSHRYPLPSRYRLKIDASTAFTLIATGRVKERLKKKAETRTKTIEIIVTVNKN